VTVRERPAHFVIVLQHFRNRFRYAVEVRHLVEQACHAAFGAGAVVANRVEDERVVELADILESLDQAAGLIVGILTEPGEYFHLAGEEFSFVRRQLAQSLIASGSGASLVPAGTTPSLICRASVSSRIFVPSLIEFAFVLRDPLFRDVMRCVSGAGREVDEERLVGRE
jgi:hypothetical protein